MPNRSTETRPGLAMIANCVPPYRIHLHRLIAAGIPELKLHTLITHGPADFDWKLDVPEEIHLSHLGAAGDSPLAGTFHAPINEWRKGGRIIDYLRTNDIRAVVMFGYRYISYLRTIRYCHRNRIPLFSNNDSNIRCESQMSLLKQLTKRLVYAWWIPRVAGVMPMGQYGDQFFLKYGATPQRMYRVPYTPNYDAFTQGDPDRMGEFRRKFGLCAQRRYILYSGRLVQVKRVDLLIDSFARIARQRKEWDLLIVGDGVLGEDLRRRAPAALRARIVWTGFLEQKESILAYHAADVTVLPSDREPWAVVVQEAMAAGSAIVASDVVGAAQELVENGTSGRVFSAGDLESLVQALLDVTQTDRLEIYRRQAELSLANWRQRVDPVQEVRRALNDAGVLTCRS